MSAASPWLPLIQGLRQRVQRILTHEAMARQPGATDTAVGLAGDAADIEAEGLVVLLKALEADGTLDAVEMLVQAACPAADRRVA